ncbi:MAG TPA: AAA family ATPase [Chloroflexaceae bacterium]|nr:AAA family ATPase [Chloroflexaceae bacterium]
MELKRFHVTNFRSVLDSGWIEVDRVTAFIGVNESGKTNLLLPLWKLNPAREGEIQPTSDYPKKLFGEIREAPGRYCFIRAEFVTGSLAPKLARLSGAEPEKLQLVHVSRFFDGSFKIEFPECTPMRSIAAAEVQSILQSAYTDIHAARALKQEEGCKADLLATLQEIAEELSDATVQSATELRPLLAKLKKLLPEEPAKTSLIFPRLSQVIEAIDELLQRISLPDPGTVEKVVEAVKAALPKFVYYSNYGNLDSEIYLPHVVENLKRTGLGAKEAAKARTLRVLFKFVRLSPEEILELGQDFLDHSHPARQPTDAEIAVIAEKKRERSILLQSAGSTLTDRFREWWKQGDYRFRFEADGDHFRIWVADDRRPEEIELESRSTGLQWFLSFYLVFLVESEEAHRDAILLLDEPGLSLHPLAQRNLSAFFDGLSQTNQIIYTTHSPFLVDADRLDRARKVYVAADGTTKATENLRESPGDTNQAGAAYAVHSALNLNVAESLLLGCQPVIVEGASDQHYLTTIKTLLIRGGKITPKRELIFPPSGGTKTARMIASILTGRDESLPLVLLDNDVPGKKMAAEMRSGLYQEAPDRILTIEQFTGVSGSEIEDLLPSSLIAAVLDRWLRDPEEAFADVVRDGEPIVPQIEAWASRHHVRLPPHWKVELAKRVKQQALNKGIAAIDESLQEKWITLFKTFDAAV